MIPKINFLTSYYLQSRILSTPYDREVLNKFLIEIETLFNKHKEFILTAIASESGVNWVVKQIDVYLFQGWQSSMSIPLLLNNYGENVNFCFFNLIHELIHNNILHVEIKDNDANWDHFELEAIVNTILIRVLKTIYSQNELDKFSFHAEFGGVYKYVWKRTREINSNLKKLNKSVSFWLEENYL